MADFELTEEQEKSATAVLNHPHHTLVTGWPGTAKSTLQSVCHAALTSPAHGNANNVVFVSVAPTAIVAEQCCRCHAPRVPTLHGAPCFTMDSFLLNAGLHKRFAAAAASGSIARVVFAIDEVFMLSAAHFNEFHHVVDSIARHVKVQLWMFGDTNQLQAPCNLSVCNSQRFISILAMKAKTPTLFVQLTELHRFPADDEMRDFVKLLISIERGNPDPRLVAKLCLMMEERTIKPTLPMPDPATRDIICLRHTHKESDSINQATVEKMHFEHGASRYILVGSKGGCTEFVVNQNVVVTKNQRDEDGRISVSNGSIRQVDAFLGTETTHARAVGCLNTRTLKIDKALCAVLRNPATGCEDAINAHAATDDDKTDDAYVLPVKPASCITVHKAQGMTIKTKASIDLRSLPSYELALVALTRTTRWANCYFTAVHFDTVMALMQQKVDPHVAKVQRLIARRTTQQRSGA